ncbi:MAG TPA: trypsin-like serine protease [Acetobacteraceae bacterium]|nr:trypsin-like serine protease [Acetobacteraceae bacterium]
MSPLWFPTFAALLALAGVANAQPPPENTGTVVQPLVLGRVVDAATREAQGLLTLASPEGTCSASMLNDYWAITAAHCVISGQGSCPTFAASQIQLTANWTINAPNLGWVDGSKTVRARQVITYGVRTVCPGNGPAAPSDIALLQVGRHDFGRPDVPPRKLDPARPLSNATVTAYGRGIEQLAFLQNGVPMPSVGNDTFRSVEFALTRVMPTTQPNEYSFFGGAGATIAGGDSGGPTLIQDWDNPLSPRRRLEWRLLGVHSWCSTTCLPGQTCTGANTWRWTTRVDQCWDASILPVRDRILAAIDAVPADDSFVGSFGTVPPEVLARKRALYAVSLDEPLVAPAGAASDVQLTFESCFALRVLQGCPVGPRYEEWSYNPATRQILHVDSGKCLNISGARRDPGAWIILFPCVGAANEKWSATGTSVLTFRSDHSGLCLHAVPGRLGRSTNVGFTLPTPGTLTQMPCDGSDSQQFRDVDADWFRRNGPR